VFPFDVFDYVVTVVDPPRMAFVKNERTDEGSAGRYGGVHCIHIVDVVGDVPVLVGELKEVGVRNDLHFVSFVG